eukprot:3314236-Prymnesium_polylepis.1
MALSRMRVIPSAPSDGKSEFLDPTKSSRQVCEKENTLMIERVPARNARWYVFFPDYVRGSARKGWAVATWRFG